MPGAGARVNPIGSEPESAPGPWASGAGLSLVCLTVNTSQGVAHEQAMGLLEVPVLNKILRWIFCFLYSNYLKLLSKWTGLKEDSSDEDSTTIEICLDEEEKLELEQGLAPEVEKVYSKADSWSVFLFLHSPLSSQTFTPRPTTPLTHSSPFPVTIPPPLYSPLSLLTFLLIPTPPTYSL